MRPEDVKTLDDVETWISELDNDYDREYAIKHYGAYLDSLGHDPKSLVAKIQSGVQSDIAHEYDYADDDERAALDYLLEERTAALGTLGKPQTYEWETISKNFGLDDNTPIDKIPESVISEASRDWGMTRNDARETMRNSRRAKAQTDAKARNEYTKGAVEAGHSYTAAAMDNDTDTMEALREKYKNDPQMLATFDDMDKDNSGVSYAVNRLNEWAFPRAYETAMRQAATGSGNKGEVITSAVWDGLENLLTFGNPFGAWARKGIGKVIAGEGFNLGPKTMARIGKFGGFGADALQSGLTSALVEAGNAATTNSDYNVARPIGTGLSTFTAPSLAEGAVSVGGSLLSHVPAFYSFMRGVNRGLRRGSQELDKNDVVLDLVGQQEALEKLWGLNKEQRKLQTKFDNKWNFDKRVMDAQHETALERINQMPNGRDKNHALNEFNEQVAIDNEVFNQRKANAKKELNEQIGAMESSRQATQTRNDLDTFEKDYGVRLEGVKNPDGSVSPWLFTTPRQAIDDVVHNANSLKSSNGSDWFSDWLYSHPKVATIIGDPEPKALKGTEDNAAAVGKWLGDKLGGLSDMTARSKATTEGDIGWTIPFVDTKVTESKTDKKARDKYAEDKRKKDEETRKLNELLTQTPFVLVGGSESELLPWNFK